MIPDMKLSDHFSLYELTTTSNAALQEKNRELDNAQVQKLATLALQCEAIRKICGEFPLRVHSGYRSLSLNGATKGASTTSQHPRCEAVDFDVSGQPLEDTFNKLLDAARAGEFSFGQLILESADRGYKDADGRESIAHWVHCSVIGTLPPEKVGQAMKMVAGADGKQHYELVEKLTFKEA
jgi:zinc D-Ala-D-Ala carboxypeptidase